MTTYTQLRSYYSRFLAKDDQAVARLAEQCTKSPQLCQEISAAADAVLVDPLNIANYSPTMRQSLAILMHQAAATMLLGVAERVIEANNERTEQ